MNPKPRLILVFLTILTSITYSFADSDSLSNLYYTQAETYRKNAQPDSAIIFYKKAAERYQSIGSIEDFVNAYNKIGVVLTRQDKYQEAKEYLAQALSIGKTKLDSLNLTLATTYISFGVVYSAEDNFQLSLENHFKALSIRLAKLSETHSDVATSYGNIGNVYFRNKDYPKAIEAHIKAMKIREQLFGMSSTEVAQSYNNLGNGYKEIKDYDQALFYYEKYLNIKLASNATSKDLAKIYLNLSEVYDLLGNKKKADYYKEKSEIK